MPPIERSGRQVPRKLLFPLVAALLALAGSGGCGGDAPTALGTAQEHGAAEKLISNVSGTGKVAIVTQRYDNQRTGLNGYEPALAPTSVAGLKKRATFPVDGDVYAQPLLAPAAITSTDSTVHDVVFVATENNSVYALDATSLNLLWQAKLMTTKYGAAAVTTTVSSSDVRCSDISPQYGITGTPVIDLTTGTLYVVSNTKEGSHTPKIVYRLHALDITTGDPKVPSVVIQATVPGSGAGTRRGSITFNPTRHLQRAGLLLTNGTLAIAFSGHCDVDPYHGWIMSYDATSLAQKAVWTTTPNGTEGGIWMAGAGITSDDNGNAFVAVGNGTYDGSTAFGDSVVQLDLANLLTRPVASWFTPSNQATLASQDLDLGSGGVLLASDRGVLVAGGKDGTLYVMSVGNLGGYGSPSVQALTGATGNGLYSSAAYWNGNVYFQGKGQPLQAYAFDSGNLLHQSWHGATSSGFPGASPVVSATGPTATDAVVWTLQTDGFNSGSPPVLHAYDAASGTELYSSAGDPAPGTAVKFTVPVVANGSIYVGSSGWITRYGL